MPIALDRAPKLPPARDPAVACAEAVRARVPDPRPEDMPRVIRHACAAAAGEADVAAVAADAAWAAYSDYEWRGDGDPLRRALRALVDDHLSEQLRRPPRPPCVCRIS